ncbi:MAG: hypothetical protein ACOC44_20355 [Promethearchaeia archaeon]
MKNIEKINKKIKKIDVLEEKVKRLEKKIKNSFIISKDKSLLKENSKFLEEEKWIKENKRKLDSEIIAFRKKGRKLELLAHSADREKLLEKIDKLLKKKKISSQDKIIFR